MAPSPVTEPVKFAARHACNAAGVDDGAPDDDDGAVDGADEGSDDGPDEGAADDEGNADDPRRVGVCECVAAADTAPQAASAAAHSVTAMPTPIRRAIACRRRTGLTKRDIRTPVLVRCRDSYSDV